MAIYAVDPGHHPTTQQAARTQPTVAPVTSNEMARPRYKFLPDGSIVDFGLRVRNEQLRKQANIQPKPNVQTKTNSVASPVWSSPLHASASQYVPVLSEVQHAPVLSEVQHAPVLSTSHHAPVFSTSQLAQTLSTAQHAQTLSTSQHAPSLTNMDSFAIPLAFPPEMSSTRRTSAAPQFNTTTSMMSTTQERKHFLDPNSGIPVGHLAMDDSLSHLFDDPRVSSTHKTDDSHKPMSFTGGDSHRPMSSTGGDSHRPMSSTVGDSHRPMSSTGGDTHRPMTSPGGDTLRPMTSTVGDSSRAMSSMYPLNIPTLPLKSAVFTTQVAGLNFTILPTSTTRRRTTVAIPMTTTTTAPTTTTTLRPTTTKPKPTRHPDAVAFYSQGGGMSLLLSYNLSFKSYNIDFRDTLLVLTTLACASYFNR